MKKILFIMLTLFSFSGYSQSCYSAKFNGTYFNTFQHNTLDWQNSMSNFSVRLWCRLDTSSNQQYVLFECNNDSLSIPTFPVLYVHGDTVFGTFDSTIGAVYGTYPNDTMWHFISLTRNVSMNAFYLNIDNVFVDTLVNSLITGTENLYNIHVGSSWHGQISMFDLYQGTNVSYSRAYFATGNTKVFYPFNEGPGGKSIY